MELLYKRDLASSGRNCKKESVATIMGWSKFNVRKMTVKTSKTRSGKMGGLGNGLLVVWVDTARPGWVDRQTF